MDELLRYNWRSFGFAIITQAVNDYKSALLHQQKHLDRYQQAIFNLDGYHGDNEEIIEDLKHKVDIAKYACTRDESTITSCEKFFRSDICAVYADDEIDGPKIIRIIRERLANGDLK